jgi:quinol monooxygenase YgiN
MNDMIISLLRVIALSDKRDAIVDVLRSVIDMTQGLVGCLGCACYEEQNNQSAVLYLEQWESKEDLQRHIQSDRYLRVISAMELAIEAPEIVFHEVSKSMGMELIEALRTDLRLPNPL